MCDASNSVTSAQSATLQYNINIALTKKSQDSAKSQGEGVVSLIKAAADLGKAVGKGQTFDAVG
jgi:hypothetical protein